MKITVYTITECQFSKQEKEYLQSHGVQFEEKNVSSNREFLTEMLAVGSNFAGTPVTKIDTDDGKTVVLKGFTKEEFDKTLGFEAQPAAPATQQPEVAAPQAPVVADAQPADVSAPAPADMTPTPEPVAPAQPTVDPAMASILNNLEQQVQEPTPQPPVAAMPAQQPPQPIPPPGAPQPTIPDPQF